jgi:aryl-alcohol dehydrogenase-like predicted oxidoreductase
MIYNKLGNSDLMISAIGLGTWAIGGGGWTYAWGPQDKKESAYTIEKAMDLGINWIDTAPVYGLGNSELIIGRTLRQLKKKPIIASKCGLCWDEKRKLFGCLKKESIKKELEESLKRLKTDAIDIYQIHWPNPDEDIEEGWETIQELKKEGKIRYGGVSNFSIDQLKRINSIAPTTSLQPPYNLLDNKIEKEIMPYCEANQIGLITYSPMHKGLLTGKFTKERLNNLPLDDHRRKRDPFFHEPKFSQILSATQKLTKIAQQKNITLAQLSIAWILKKEEVTAVIAGARKPSQIEETAKAISIMLDESDITEINRIFKNVSSL